MSDDRTTSLSSLPQPDRVKVRFNQPWMRVTLVLAGVYNLVWGAAVVFFPTAGFNWLNLEVPNYIPIWQCLGMVIGVYGIGYLAASTDPTRHWPIVLVGLLGKILGPVGFVYYAALGEFPWAFGFTIITNDLIWWVPFAIMLWRSADRFNFEKSLAHSSASDESNLKDISFDEAITQFTSHTGETIASISDQAPVLVLFLRHAGCIFCREALADVKAGRASIEAQDTRIVFVHMSPEGEDGSGDFAALTHRMDVGDIPRISDPSGRMYRAFGLKRGSFRQLFGLRSTLQGMKATLRGHRVGALKGDGFQMPGVFLVHHREIIRAYRHETAGDQPDYENMACAVNAMS